MVCGPVLYLELFTISIKTLSFEILDIKGDSASFLKVPRIDAFNELCLFTFMTWTEQSGLLRELTHRFDRVKYSLALTCGNPRDEKISVQLKREPQSLKVSINSIQL